MYHPLTTIWRYPLSSSAVRSSREKSPERNTVLLAARRRCKTRSARASLDAAGALGAFVIVELANRRLEGALPSSGGTPADSELVGHRLLAFQV